MCLFKAALFLLETGPALKRMKSIIAKRINADNFIKDIKREIVFKEEAKDELHGI